MSTKLEEWVIIEHAEPEKYEDPPEGLSGYWWESDIVCVPVITAEKTGAFLPWLYKLEAKNKTVFFPTIINGRLDRLLRLRGYVDAVVPVTSMGEPVFGLALDRGQP